MKKIISKNNINCGGGVGNRPEPEAKGRKPREASTQVEVELYKSCELPAAAGVSSNPDLLLCIGRMTGVSSRFALGKTSVAALPLLRETRELYSSERCRQDRCPLDCPGRHKGTLEDEWCGEMVFGWSACCYVSSYSCCGNGGFSAHCKFDRPDECCSDN